MTTHFIPVVFQKFSSSHFSAPFISAHISFRTFSRVYVLVHLTWNGRPFFSWDQTPASSLEHLIDSQQNTSGFLDKWLALLHRPICSLCFQSERFGVTSTFTVWHGGRKDYRKVAGVKKQNFNCFFQMSGGAGISYCFYTVRFLKWTDS